MGKLFNGGAAFGFSLNYNTAVPVDTRMVVKSLTDLKNPLTWVSGNYDAAVDANNVYVVYLGMAVTVVDEATIYVYTPEVVSGANIGAAASWAKLATGASSDSFKGEITNSSTLKEVTTGTGDSAVTTIETGTSIKYVAATAATGTEGEADYVAGVPAHIALVDKNDNELSTVPVSDIIGNGVLDSSSYDKNSGNLTLTFKLSDGSTKNEVVNLSDMLDINDVLVDTNSTDYLSVDLTGGENSLAKFAAKVVNLNDATKDVLYTAEDTLPEGKNVGDVKTAGNTGLTDAADVKTYVDEAVADAKANATSAIEGLDVQVTTVKDTAEYVKVTYSETDGLVNISNVEVKTANLADTVGMVKNADGTYSAGTAGQENGLATAADVTSLIISDEEVIAAALNDLNDRVDDNTEAIGTKNTATTGSSNATGLYKEIEDAVAGKNVTATGEEGDDALVTASATGNAVSVASTLKLQDAVSNVEDVLLGDAETAGSVAEAKKAADDAQDTADDAIEAIGDAAVLYTAEEAAAANAASGKTEGEEGYIAEGDVKEAATGLHKEIADAKAEAIAAAKAAEHTKTTVTAGTANGTISVDGGADITIFTPEEETELSVKAGSESYVSVNDHEIEILTSELGDTVGLTKQDDGTYKAADGTTATPGLATAADVAAEIVADEKVVAAALNDHESRIKAAETAIGTANTAATGAASNATGLYKKIEDVAADLDGKNVDAEGETGDTALVSASADENKVTVASTTKLQNAVAAAETALQSVGKGTDGSFVTTTVSEKGTGTTLNVSVAVTTVDAIGTPTAATGLTTDKVIYDYALTAVATTDTTDYEDVF